MKRSRLLSLSSCVQFLIGSSVASPQPSISLNINPPSGSPTSVNPFAASSTNLGQTTNLTNDVVRWLVTDTPIALDFYEYHAMGEIPRQDVLMCVIEGLSKIFGKTAAQPVPRLSTFYYEKKSFIHIQDYNPTPGREHTYGDMAATLRGIGEFMTYHNYWKTLEFQIWSITLTSQTKIGSGGVGGAAATGAPRADVETS